VYLIRLDTLHVSKSKLEAVPSICLFDESYLHVLNASRYGLHVADGLFNPLGKFANKAIYFACVNFLARSANLLTGLYILPSVISFFKIFLLWAKLSQYLLDRLSRFFYQMEGICDPVHFLRFLKGRCHGNQFCANNGKLPTFVVLALRNEMG